MKLSQLTTEKATDVLCTIAPLALNILSDEELMEELRAAIDFGNANTTAERIALTVGKISKILPIVLKKRRVDLFEILAVLNEKTVEEIGKQNILKTMSQVRDISKDKELLDFFKSCTGTEESE